MPRWASRINLEITNVRVERLNDITDADVASEGASRYSPDPLCVDDFRQLWESINGAGSWQQNPWVWVVEFKRIGESA